MKIRVKRVRETLSQCDLFVCFRETSSAALTKSISRVEALETELLEAHTKHRDSLRQLYHT